MVKLFRSVTLSIATMVCFIGGFVFAVEGLKNISLVLLFIQILLAIFGTLVFIGLIQRQDLDEHDRVVSEWRFRWWELAGFVSGSCVLTTILSLAYVGQIPIAIAVLICNCMFYFDMSMVISSWEKLKN